MIHEVRDIERARQLVAQGLCLMRAAKPTATSCLQALTWAHECASSDDPLPPVGFVFDLGFMALGDLLEIEPQPSEPAVETTPDKPANDTSDASTTSSQPALLESPNVISENATVADLVRRYEDYVIGKLYNDSSFERGADAIRNYSSKDRVKGLSFLIHQFQERAGFTGIKMSPAVLKSALTKNPLDLFREGQELLESHGLLSELADCYEELIRTIRIAPEMLAAEDVFELERKTAIAGFGQRVALRQVLQHADFLENQIERRQLRPLKKRQQQVSTRMLEEDAYPVGGFSSISNKGTLESLLQSQLAYMEPSSSDERPDMFDIKFVRDELLYYARDENLFLRQRKTFCFVMHSNLLSARMKHKALPYQQIILVLSLLVASVRLLIKMLGNDSLRFEFLWLSPKEAGAPALTNERSLIELVFREQIENGAVFSQSLDDQLWENHCEQSARRSLCHALSIGVEDQIADLPTALITRFQVKDAIPLLGFDFEEQIRPEGDLPLQTWTNALKLLMERWI